MGLKNVPLAVVKVGGDILEDEQQKIGLGKNISGLIELGWKVIILHGGGPQVSSLQARCGVKARKVAGRRITSEEDLTFVKQALCGQVNVDLVSSLQSSGVNAFGCHGASGKIILAEKRPPRVVSGGGSDPIDFGEVGDVTKINTTVLNELTEIGLVPVIASIGMNKQGRIFNINADITAVEITKQLKADLLIFVTGVGGVYEDINNPKTRFSSLTPASAKKYIENGVIADGMIPKVEEALLLLEAGVKYVAIAEASSLGTFSGIANGESQYGTRISKFGL